MKVKIGDKIKHTLFGGEVCVGIVEDIQICRQGEKEEVVWTGVEDDDAYIVFSAPTKEQVDNIKSILKNG